MYVVVYLSCLNKSIPSKSFVCAVCDEVNGLVTNLAEKLDKFNFLSKQWPQKQLYG